MRSPRGTWRERPALTVGSARRDGTVGGRASHASTAGSAQRADSGRGGGRAGTSHAGGVDWGAVGADRARHPLHAARHSRSRDHHLPSYQTNFRAVFFNLKIHFYLHL